MQQRIVIIAAGGKGTRIQSNLPKQYMNLLGKPVLMHTMQAFATLVDKVIVVIHPEMISFWKELCQEYHFELTHEIVNGGETRFQSVRNGLDYIFNSYPEYLNDHTAIAIHDAARPIIGSSTIRQSFEWALKGVSNVLATKSTNSIRLGDHEISTAIDRNKVWQIQTPQTFPATILRDAFTQEESIEFTDDASVVEKKGYSIKLLESTPKNIKITFQEDFEIAQIYLTKLNR